MSRSHKEKSCSVGDRITFGHIADPVKSGVSHGIIWHILAISEGKALVLSEDLLTVQPFHFEEGNIEWEYCSLRSKLNTTFYQTAFSPEEQEIIVRTLLDEKVADKVFLLSTEELEQYLSAEITSDDNGFDRKKARMAVPASWSAETGDDSVGNYWWLRSHVRYNRRFGSCIAHVNNSGYTGETPAYCERWVRPAMWIKPTVPGTL